ncbi:hypothetical protein ARNL5_03889 [Anaerolineae bacterium]|nr:hypothetical protein ARNL5_03889 [Anaerolineae bacterium]
MLLATATPPLNLTSSPGAACQTTGALAVPESSGPSTRLDATR